ncbi:MAG: undecaprenyldiphospho-muramoylpentapeptide beta-N-acetylglucosaminyltransferase [Proteobacteria bacterium]|nr:undecaprenyldiphospho-muramoylpentapeptide beta-N-acetylglucosaminyltransferase [Pseudomonadota bacterium]
MKIKKTIALTGGGTAGHVMPNLALAPDLAKAGFEVIYIGSDGVERSLVEKAGIKFFRVSSGKLRRYFSWENLKDIFKVLLGFFQAIALISRLRPDAVFSKGGFVAVPVCLAAKVLGIPVVSHESDYSPGLANRIIAKFARKLLYSFPETKNFLPESKSERVDTPIRAELLKGDRNRGLSLCGFSSSLPVLLFMGGSQGAQRLNDALFELLPEIVDQFQIVHLSGKGKSIPFTHRHYKSFEFLGNELPDVFAATDFVVCRAGANSIFEMLALKIPMLLIPLEIGSRGDQILNAKSFESRGWALTLSELKLSKESLRDSIALLVSKADEIKQAQKSVGVASGNSKIVEIIANSIGV